MPDSPDTPSAAWLALLAAWSLLWAGTDPPRVLTPDTVDLLRFADCLRRVGEGTAPTCAGVEFWPLGLPAAVAGLAVIGVPPEVGIRLLPLVSGALLVVPIAALGRTLGRPPAGVVAAIAAVPFALFRFQSFVPDTRAPALFVTLCAYACLARWMAGSRVGWLAGAGAAAGLLPSLRPEGVLVGLVLSAIVVHQVAFPGTRRPRRTAARLAPLAAWSGGALAGGFPPALLVHRLSGRLHVPVRDWEIVGARWIEDVPLPLVRPLLGMGQDPAPLREALRADAAAGRLSLEAHDHLATLAAGFARGLPDLPAYLARAAPPELVVLAAVGAWLTFRAPGGRARLAVSGLFLAPMVPLVALPQTFNPYQPESNLLLLPAALLCLAAVTLSKARARLDRWRRGAGTVAIAVVLGAWTVRGVIETRALVATRGAMAFEGSEVVRRAGAWLREHVRPGTAVHASFAGAAVVFEAGLPAGAWPSAWELPGWWAARATGPPVPAGVVLLTSADGNVSPLELEAWSARLPEMDLLHYEGDPGGGVWVAILALPAGPPRR